MDEFKENLTNILKENRKNLSDNSIKTYNSSFISINKKFSKNWTDFYISSDKSDEDDSENN